MTTDRAPVGRRLLAPNRLLLLGCYLLIVAIQLLQTVGRTTFDTKLDLLVDPGRFMSESLTLWSSQIGMGQIQNQAYGYLFPLGPAFWLGHACSLSAALTERLWSTAVTLAAFEGARRLALAWGGLGERAALLAGAAFVTAPRFLTTVGVLTGEILPTAMLPWVVLPLVLARRGRLGACSAALLSGAALLFMGGQNAAEVVATLPLPAVVLVHAVWRRELPWRAVPVWLGAVVAACAWWVGPLLLLGRYSPPFLNYIESAANTTSVLGWVNSVRGADHWVAYVPVGGRPWWPAGYALATTGWLVVVTALVAALSLAGLVGRGVPDRVCLTLPLAIGLVCLVAAHGGDAGGLVAAPLRSLLDGPLAALRNVHKVDPLVRLPMALGFSFLARDGCRQLAALLARVPSSPASRRSGRPSRGPWARPSAAAGAVAGACAVGMLAASAQPAFAGELRQPPGWTAIPAPWHRAAAAVDALPAGSRVLVVPASGFGLQVWGNTVDEPLQPLTTGDWVARGQAPLEPGATVRLLDSVETLLASGRGSAGLAPLLARSGITHVLVRTDLDPFGSDAPSPSLVVDALETSPGLRFVRGFGVPYGATMPLQLWRVGSAPTADARVSAVPEADARSVQGGPEALLPLLQAGLLKQGQPVLLAGQNPSTRGPVDVLTDTLQRREQAFGRVNDAVSSIMAAGDPFRTDRAAHEYPVFAHQQQTVASYPGLKSVSASSSGGYVDILGAVHPEEGPYSALDSDDATAWVTAPFTDPVGQALSVVFRSPQVLASAPVTLWNAPGEPVVTSLTVTTDTGSLATPVAADADQVLVAVPPGATRTLRLSVSGVDSVRGTGQVGVSDVFLPGVDLSRTLVVPGSAAPTTSMLFSSAPPVRACTYPGRVCAAGSARPAEESAALDRSFDVAGRGRWNLRIGAVARSSPATDALLAPVQTGYSITASSVLSDDPVVAPTFAFDGNGLTSWVSAPGDRTPTLKLSWPKPRTLSRIRVGLGTQPGVRLPTTVRLRAGDQVRTVPVGAGFYGFFKPLRTRSLTLTFSSGRGPNLAGAEPMEISEVVVAGLHGFRYSPSTTSRTGQPCGFGPPVYVDGVRHPTRVTGTLGDVLDGSPLAVRLCGTRTLSFGPGPHRLRIASTAQFQAVQAVLTPAATPAAPVVSDRGVRVQTWGDTQRTVRVSAGPAALLWVPENDNAGWVATARGRTLQPVVVDGWAQGWRLPAGAGLDIDLRFTPQRSYLVSLLVGLALAVVLLGAAAGALVRRRTRPAPRRRPTLPTRAADGVEAGPGQGSHPAAAAAWLAVLAASALAGAGLLAGALLGAPPQLRGVWLRRGLVVAAVTAAACWQVAAAGEQTGADLLAAAAVGLVVGPGASRD